MNSHGGPSAEFWAKTLADGRPGITVREHCLNVGLVARELVALLPPAVRDVLPGTDGDAAVLLAALHDIGKITVGFQAKCPAWMNSASLPPCTTAHLALSVSDHAYAGQAFLQALPPEQFSSLWAVAVGSHHGRPKGRSVRLGGNSGRPEALSEWAVQHRHELLTELKEVFGALPSSPPDPRYGAFHSDLWLVAGLITIADWIGSNEAWFPPGGGLSIVQSTSRASAALGELGWPGGKLRTTAFSEAFGAEAATGFQPNSVQNAVAAAALQPGIVIVEGPMGCGKTEAALFAAQQLIAAGHHHGIYFALPTQLTSNRIHRRVEQFLRNCLDAGAALRLAHGSAWLEDDFDLRLRPTFRPHQDADREDTDQYLHEARSWFVSGKRALLAPYGVGTVDQALQSVIAVKHFFVRRFALAGKVVILDEVHSYDVYTGTLITALIRELIALRCSVIILSATLTAERRKELLGAAGVVEHETSGAYPLVTSGTPLAASAHSVAPAWHARAPIALTVAVLSDDLIIEELIRRAEGGQHVLWIRNTVIESQLAYRAIAASVQDASLRLGLLHSRFPFARRAELEEQWLELLGKERISDGIGSILVATQVVEQSVDIDLDFMVSDLAPTDMLLQRVGRLWRHERPVRAANAPEYWVNLPEFTDDADPRALRKALARTARVYAPFVLLRSAKVWRAKTSLRLPSDIRPLLEATYTSSPGDDPDSWRELLRDLETERAALAANAEAATRVLGNPLLEDAENVLTRRQGAPVVPVVLLRSVSLADGRVILTAMDNTQTEVGEDTWRKASAAFVHRWVVRAPRWMIPTGAPRPRWLSLHGPPGATAFIVLDDGRCVCDGQPTGVRYDRHIGLCADPSATRHPQLSTDDEFDS